MPLLPPSLRPPPKRLLPRLPGESPRADRRIPRQQPRTRLHQAMGEAETQGTGPRSIHLLRLRLATRHGEDGERNGNADSNSTNVRGIAPAVQPSAAAFGGRPHCPDSHQPKTPALPTQSPDPLRSRLPQRQDEAGKMRDKRKMFPQASGRKPSNQAEAQCYDALEARGWRVTKRGWPDFFCLKPDGGICLVEVKPNSERQLKREQWVLMRELSRFGVPCFRYDSRKGFQRIDHQTPPLKKSSTRVPADNLGGDYRGGEEG
jgi:hypothetical protein